MEKKLFLLDGMALVYRAHFALIARPILTSKGVNTSALYGFTQTLLEILKNQQPTHIAVAFDTDAPTQRHAEYKEYKATRQTMPEDLSLALPNVVRMLEAFRIPVITCDGYEADDIIGTLVRRAEKQQFRSFMVTPDKDFGQLVTSNTLLYKPGRMGDPAEILGPKEICARWGIERPEQVIDILALMGDSIDNIPGVPGIGEKTAAKLVAQFGTVENLLARAGELTGKTRERIEQHREQALLSKRLVTLQCEAPCPIELESLRLQAMDQDKVKALFVEFEFNSIGRRLFGESFNAGRGFSPPSKPGAGQPAATARPAATATPGELDLFGASSAPASGPQPPAAELKTLAQVPHNYCQVATAAERAELVKLLGRQQMFAVAARSTHPDPKQATLLGLAFSTEPHQAVYLPLSAEDASILEEFRAVLENQDIEKVGHDLKHVAALLQWRGFSLGGKLFDLMLAHSLVEPDMRHSLRYLSETYLGYTPSVESPSTLAPLPDQPNLATPELSDTAAADSPLMPPAASTAESTSTSSCECSDLSLQLRPVFERLLREKDQERVFYQIESPLVPVLASMEHQGIRVDAAALADFAAQLGREIDDLEKSICRMAGNTFNLNSPRQLGQVLFEVMKICEAPKKTRTGQYATDEQTLMTLAPDHEIVRKLLEHRAASKLKSTYADALPTSIWAPTGRVHTTYHQVMTSTGRLNSQNPNLQNIPIRTERGQEIRKAFVPRGPGFLLFSADYSQIELRIIAALSREPGLLEAFRSGQDVHTATAARVFGVPLDAVSPDMRRKAKMVNYGIAYGISSFGLSQRLGIPRKESAQIIDNYFAQFGGIRQYMDDTVAFAREHGYVQTVTGRRRYIRDIRSSNNTLRAAAERNAINAPIQGTAADMIKLAMIAIHREFATRGIRSRMLLQVHDELVFDLYVAEREQVEPLVRDLMRNAISLEVPIEVETGVGDNWLEAH
jgi:DNA polymerase-1